MRGATLALASLLLTIAAAQAAPQTERFYGYAYDLRSNRYLYTEVHEQHVEGERWLGGTIRYYTPDARLIGVKTLDFSRDPYIPVYHFEVVRDGYSEAITAVGAQIVMEKRSAQNQPYAEKRLAHVPGMCGDSGFHTCLRDHFAALLGGESYSFVLAVAGNLDSYRFRAQRIADTSFEGKPAVRFRVEPDSMLRFFVDPLVVSYEPQQRRLLEYRGLANVPSPEDGKPFVARIAYYSQPPGDVIRLPPLQPP